MKTIKVAEATHAQLDWLVAKILHGIPRGMSCLRVVRGRPEVLTDGGNPMGTRRLTNYSTDWSQGGPIIEREKISVVEGMDGDWQAGMRPYKFRYGPTPLIAAMRCYVVSKMGDTAEVPEELK